MNPSSSKSQIVDGIEYRYSSEWTKSLESEDHWRFYWSQINLIYKELKEGDSILEIGPGSGFTTNYLRSKGYTVTTIDIDEQKNPDISANIVEYDFPERYDHIIAFEVFEHIPYDKFTEILPKLKRACRKNIFFSIPRNYRIWFHFDFIIPYFKKVSFTIKLKRRRIITDHHFWELNYRDYNLKKITHSLTSAGFKIVRLSKKSLLVFFHLSID